MQGEPGANLGSLAACLHWHGATATTAMSHIAIIEKLDGKGVDWLEKSQRRALPVLKAGW
jgi:quercetin dioxygenase-like cupin family protein